MLGLFFRRFKATDALPSTNNDLNKKLLEAFASIIDKGAGKHGFNHKPASPLEPIHRFNVEHSTSMTTSKTTQTKSSMSPTSQQLLSERKNPPDIFRRNKMSPINLHKNVYLMSKMLSPSGSILSQHITKLTSKTQRHMSKAIRRARQIGILPYMYRPKVYAVKSQ